MTYEDAKKVSQYVQKYDELTQLYKAIKDDKQVIINKETGKYLYTISYIAINSHGESLSYEIDADIVANMLNKISEAVDDKRMEYLNRIHSA